MSKMHQVRKEFKEPFRDVVQGMAVMGYSPKATAQILEVNPSWFDKLCERFDLKKHFRDRKHYNSTCKPPGPPKGTWMNQPQKYSDWYLLSVLRGYSAGISSIRFNQRQKTPCADTYVKRFGSWRKAKSLAHE